MVKDFFGRHFEFGGTLGNLDESKGDYNGVLIIVLPSNFGKVNFNPQNKLLIWRKGRKDRVVSVPIADLQSAWVENAEILYIGSCASKRKTLQSQAKLHIRFWNGEDVNAYGGRVIGQVQNWEDLEVWYLKCDNPKQVKQALLNSFEKQYKKLPFANLEH